MSFYHPKAVAKVPVIESNDGRMGMVRYVEDIQLYRYVS